MFGNRLTLCELFGFKVRIDASWLILAALMAWSLAAGYFPSIQPGHAPATYWGMALAGVAGLALSIVAHELAHSLVARRHAMPISGITLFIFGGIAEMTAEPPTPKGEFLMALAGPMMSLVLSGLFLGAQHAAFLTAPADTPALPVLGYLVMLNLLLAVFNLLPAFPLDGGRMLRAALWAWRRDILWATRVTAGTGGLLGVGLMALGLWALIQGNLLGGAWWVMIGMFVRVAAIQSYRQELARHQAGRRPAARAVHGPEQDGGQ